jgi:hypothetical protein
LALVALVAMGQAAQLPKKAPMETLLCLHQLLPPGVVAARDTQEMLRLERVRMAARGVVLAVAQPTVAARGIPHLHHRRKALRVAQGQAVTLARRVAVVQVLSAEPVTHRARAEQVERAPVPASRALR